MDWLTQLSAALAYIEENLDGEIELEHAARIACCSGFHFSRMFSYMAGIPLSEYVRRRRMTRAAFDLQNSSEKIVDIALKYGYDSPTAFNRAFRSIHGISPSAARVPGAPLKAYQPISFKITVRGVTEMNYRIEQMPSFRIVGAKMTCQWTHAGQEGFKLVPKFWQDEAEAGTIPKVLGLMNSTPLGLMGVSVGDWQNEGDFDYYIAVASDMPIPEDFSEYTVPACTWAIFECKGPMPHSIQSLQERIMTEWFPGSGYNYADAPDIELYSDGDMTSDDYVCEIWVPVTK